ncbi:hypothetical protein C6560_21865 [Enterobacter sp. FS01]|nr:hypothetical protein C6560_21865 [Enterobacter sp. FS01]
MRVVIQTIHVRQLRPSEVEHILKKPQKLIFIYIGIMVVQQKLMVAIDLQNPQKDRCSSN